MSCTYPVTRTDPTTILSRVLLVCFLGVGPAVVKKVTNWKGRLYMVNGVQQRVQDNARRVRWASMGDAGTELKIWQQGPKHGFGSLPIGLAGVSSIGSLWRAMGKSGSGRSSCNHTSSIPTITLRKGPIMRRVIQLSYRLSRIHNEEST